MKTTLRLTLLSALFMTSLAQAAELIPIDVHRDANCGCCKNGSATSKPTGSRSTIMWKPT